MIYPLFNQTSGRKVYDGRTALWSGCQRPAKSGQ